MERLIDSLNQSHLPFVGRQAELERLFRFWRGTCDAQELRAALLVGEAGIGKSRLIDEVVAEIAGAGGTIIRIRLFPESATSIVPLVVQGLLFAEATRGLLRSEPEATLPSVVAALRRIARLRPTIVILEDIHLLAGDAVRDLAALLEALAEESLSLLASARPMELPARAPLERFLVERIDLDGLDREGVEQLWERIFEQAPTSELIEELSSATAGNPLAIRSALRSATRAGGISYDPAAAAWRIDADPAELGGIFRENVELLAEGMATHMSEEERTVAAALAMLGEVFSMEAAELLLPGATGFLPALIYKGTLMRPATTPAALRGPSSRASLAFTHTLLHQHLAATAQAPVASLVEVIAAGAPLYSIAPFRIIADSTIPEDIPAARIERAIEQAVEIAFRLDVGTDWMLTRDVLAAGWRLHRALPATREDVRHRELTLAMLNRELSWLRRDVRGEEFGRRLEEMLRLTEEPLPDTLLPYRLKALYHRYDRVAETDYARCIDVWNEVERLRAEHPDISRDAGYLHYLEEVARFALRAADADTLRYVEARLRGLLADPELPEPIRRAARIRVASSFLLLFDTAEELADRMAQLAELPSEFDGVNASIVMNRIMLLETTGRMIEAQEEARAAIGRLRAIGMQRNVATCALISLCARAALGLELEEVEREIARLLAGGAHASSPAFRRNVGIYLSEIGFLRGELDWTRRMIAELQPDEPPYWPEGDLLLGLADGRLVESLDRLDTSDEMQRLLDRLGRSTIDADRGTDKGADTASDAEEAALALLARPLLRVEDLLTLQATLAMLGSTGRRGAVKAASTRVRQAARAALISALAWAAERRLFPAMAPLLDRHGSYLPRKEREAWSARMAEIEQARKEEEQRRWRRKMQVRMFGTIAIGTNGEEPTPLRGARLQTMLALLVASRLVRKPLTHREFCRIAAGGETDPDLARKTANMAVIRLREAIGAEMVLTGEETYLLNLERADVDLLDASRLLEEARAALRRGALVKAIQAVKETLAIARGDVPFPGLYDDFFEALRNDFEFRLRSTAIDTARALMRESDMASAADLLRHAQECAPDDEEIGGLLHEALRACGFHAEAERVRMQVAMSSDL